jgi:hypothetical protein
MSSRHFLGIRKDERGRIAPLFAPPDAVIDALGHHRLVVDALRQGPFLPAAFRSCRDDHPAELVGRIRQHRKGLRNALGQSRDLIEMGVTIVVTGRTEEPETAPATGRAFLQQAAVRAGAAGETAVQVNHLTQHIAAMNGVSRCRVLCDAVNQKSLALAVERTKASAVASAIEARSLPGLTLDISGPWPLYSFGLRDIFGAEGTA